MLTVGQKIPDFSVIAVRPGFNHFEEGRAWGPQPQVSSSPVVPRLVPNKQALEFVSCL